MDIRRRGNKPGVKRAEMPATLSDIRRPQPPISPSQKSTPAPTTKIVPEPIEVEDLPQPTSPAPVSVPATSVNEAPEVVIETVEEPTPKAPKREKSTSKTVTKTVEIKISLPAMPDLSPITQHRAYTAAKVQAAKLPRKKLALGGIILAVALFIAGSNLLTDHNAKVAADKNGTQRDLTRGIPDYPTVLPAGKTIQDLGGWTLVSPPDRDPAFAYIDKIGNMQINVSQQPLPDDLKPDTAAKIEKLAQGYGASEKITADDTTAYIGTSEKGPQSVILNKDDLLILIKSSVHIDSDEWIKYINSLQ